MTGGGPPDQRQARPGWPERSGAGAAVGGQGPTRAGLSPGWAGTRGPSRSLPGLRGWGVSLSPEARGHLSVTLMVRPAHLEMPSPSAPPGRGESRPAAPGLPSDGRPTPAGGATVERRPHNGVAGDRLPEATAADRGGVGKRHSATSRRLRGGEASVGRRCPSLRAPRAAAGPASGLPGGASMGVRVVWLSVHGCGRMCIRVSHTHAASLNPK